MITLTPKAQEFMKTLVAKQNGVALRVYIENKGCSGLSYAYKPVDTIDATDLTSVLQSGLTVCVPPASMPYLKGLTIDYVASPDQLGLSSIKFMNPKASHCGCGKSFNVDQ